MNKNVQNFENVILDDKNTNGISYRIDKNIEASVRYEYLCESFGEQEVNSAMDNLKLVMFDLYDQEKFQKVADTLNNPQ